MAGAGSNIGLKLIRIGVGIPVTIAVRKLTNRAFAAARPDAEYRDPKDAGVQWKDALTWAAISAAGVAAAELITRKTAEESFRVLTGSEPPPQLSKGQKKALKAQEKQEKKQAKQEAKALAKA